MDQDKKPDFRFIKKKDIYSTEELDPEIIRPDNGDPAKRLGNPNIRFESVLDMLKVRITMTFMSLVAFMLVGFFISFLFRDEGIVQLARKYYSDISLLDLFIIFLFIYLLLCAKTSNDMRKRKELFQIRIGNIEKDNGGNIQHSELHNKVRYAESEIALIDKISVVISKLDVIVFVATIVLFAVSYNLGIL